jgi:hypothetical protein
MVILSSIAKETLKEHTYIALSPNEYDVTMYFIFKSHVENWLRLSMG